MSGTEPRTYDVVVIGGGPPGENVAGRVAAAGLSVVLAEHERVGGECSYWACMPSKALLRPVELLAEVRRLPGAAEAVNGDLDVAKVLARRDEFTHHLDDSSQVSWLTSSSIDLVRGHARLAGPRRVEVVEPGGGTTVIEARHAVVLATGTLASVPPIPGLREAHPWTSREATNVKEVPRRLVVLGGGVVAVEMAQAMRALGAEEVTVVERAPRLLGRVEEFASEMVADALRAGGVDVLLGVSAQRVERAGPGAPVTVTLDDGRTLVGDEVLCALGRTPATADIGLATVGLPEHGYVETGDDLRVGAVDGGWLYAVGDVTGRNLLTHMGKYQARVAGDVIAARARGEAAEGPKFRASADHGQVPQVVFTDPQVAAVGLTEAQAREARHPVRTVEYDIGSVAGASLLADGYTGRAKLVVDSERRVLLGATFVGPAIDDLLHSATVALVGEVTLDRLWHAVPAYPTVSEVWLRLLETYGL